MIKLKHSSRDRLHMDRRLGRKTDRLAKRVGRTLEDAALDARFTSTGQWWVVPEWRRLIVSDTTGLRAYWASYGGYIEASELEKHSVPMLRDVVGIHISEHEDHFDDRNRWKKIESMAVDRIVGDIKKRVKAVQEEAGTDVNTVVAIWDRVKAKSFFENDNWYFHVLLRMDIGVMVFGQSNGPLQFEIKGKS